jgi:diacylglycerol kinase family enzyme
MKLRFILNPASGSRRRNERLVPLLRRFVSARGLDADVTLTEQPGHATALAREAAEAGCARVVAVGGDGTMNEVAQALFHTPVELAIVPTGSGNGLARYLGLPPAIASLELAASPRARAACMDTGSAAGFSFFNAMGIGLDAEVSRRFNRLKRRGFAAYAWAALSAFAGRRSERCAIRVPLGAEGRPPGDEAGSAPRDPSGNGDGEVLDVLLVAVANSDQYGNGARIAPGARLDDGLLDLVAISRAGTAACAILAARLFLGTLDRSPRVRHLRASRFLIGRAAPGLLHADGECRQAPAQIEISVVPASLRIVAPEAYHARLRLPVAGGGAPPNPSGKASPRFPRPVPTHSTPPR